jgi:hypothetical protein
MSFTVQAWSFTVSNGLPAGEVVSGDLLRCCPGRWEAFPGLLFGLLTVDAMVKSLKLAREVVLQPEIQLINGVNVKVNIYVFSN